MAFKTTLTVLLSILCFSPALLESDVFDVGKPLFLTPYIENGEIEKAQFLSRVEPLPEECTDSYVKSYSGFITVNKQYNSNMFFWYIPAQEADPGEAPLMLWMSGGPGASSLLTLFNFNGPFVIGKDGKMTRRELDWTKKYSIIYLDNPIGAGFSFTDDNAGYSRNQTHVAENIYSFMLQFYSLFPGLLANDLYVGGISYGGKHVPSIAYKIHNENPTAEKKMNLKGLIMGAPFTDPKTVISELPNYLHYTGLINKQQTVTAKTLTNNVIQSIDARDYSAAFQKLAVLLFGGPTSSSFATNATGLSAFMSILKTTMPKAVTSYAGYVEKMAVRRAVHAGDKTFYPASPTVFGFLSQDFLTSVKPWLETILNSNEYKVLMFAGQLDITVTVAGVEATIDSMANWNDLDTYRLADRKIWKVNPEDEDVAGYVQTAGNLSFATVIGAGHLGPFDQPERHLDLVARFVDGNF